MCMTSTKEQIKSQLEKMSKQLDRTREALRDLRTIEDIKVELAKEFNIKVGADQLTSA